MKNSPGAKPFPCLQSSALSSAGLSAISICHNKPPLSHAGNYRFRSRTAARIDFISLQPWLPPLQQGSLSWHQSSWNGSPALPQPGIYCLWQQGQPGNSPCRWLHLPAAFTHLYYLNNWSALLPGSTLWSTAFGNKYLIVHTTERSSDGLRCDSRSVY